MTMKKNRLEWSVFGISLVLIATVVGLLLYEHFTTGRGPADLAVTLGEAVASTGGYAVPVDVRNSGGTSAEDVQVSVSLRGAAAEAAGVTLPYVPYRSQRRAWVMFDRDPSAGTLEARVLGYRQP